ncbi:MAG: LamG domain-containing protein, partial [Planctomycetota bacterium]
MCSKSTYLVASICLIGLTASLANADIQRGLVGYWPLNEGTGTVTADASGNGHDGTMYNGVTWISPGFIGNAAVSIDGNPGSRISVGNWDPGESFSLAIWARWTGEQNKAERTGLIGKRNDWSAEGMRWFSEVTTAGQVRMRNFTQTISSPAGAMTEFIDEWAHIAITFDGNTVIIYLNAEEVGSGSFSLGPLVTAALGLGCKQGNSTSSNEIFSGDLDEARIYNLALSVTDVKEIFEWTGKPGKASNPKPSDGQTDVSRNVTLSWTPGEFAPPANGHRVYLSENFDDIANGVGGITVDANSYTPPQRLDFETTYYWRVDEVNAPPDSTVFQGGIWSFTTEPFVHVIENVTATASSNEPGKGPENTVNGSGLDSTGLLHTNESLNNMWLSGQGAVQPTWILFEFDNIYKLYEMWVWNSNDSLEAVIGLGFKDVTIEYSTDGVDFVALGTTHEFAQAPGSANYAHNTTIDMAGVGAKYVRLTANSNWKGLLPQFGLSEVRFFSIPVQAREPNPGSMATDVPLDLTLGWRAGREADKHDVYFSDDFQAVADGTAPVTTATDTSHGPLALDLGKTYFWRVDEVNDAETPATWQGDIWNFSTIQYLVVEDFESYTDNDGANEAIWQSWIDGFGTADNGSQVGYLFPPYAEQAIVHGGKQSMPLNYNNQGTFDHSQATKKLDSQRDWTVRGIAELSVWFRGYPGSVGSFVEGPVGTYTMTAGGVDIWGTADEFHFAYKQLSGVGSITAKIESVELTDVWAKAGVMIRETLDAGSKFAAVYVTPTNADGTPTQGVRFQARTDTAIGATSDTSVATPEQMALKAPYWVKIERDVAGNFRGSYSSNGTAWTPMVWRPSISMDSTVYIGLALTSHNVGVTGQAVFSNVQTTGTVTGQWQSQDIGLLSNSAQPMYVAVANKTGTPKLVFHDDPAATQTDAWTQWRIDLQQFADQGINLSDVDSISIGVGDKNNPGIGGSGEMFFD